MLTAVDYVTGFLLHDTCNILLRIIKDFLGSNGEKVGKYIEWLEVTRNFLKVQYISHARKSDNCRTHGLEHGLSKPPNYAEQYESDLEENTDSDFEVDPDRDSDQEDDSDKDSKQADHADKSCLASSRSRKCFTCNACKFPFFFLQKLSEDGEEEHRQRLSRIGLEEGHDDKLEDVPSVFSDCREKLYLFMAHKTLRFFGSLAVSYVPLLYTLRANGIRSVSWSVASKAVRYSTRVGLPCGVQDDILPKGFLSWKEETLRFRWKHISHLPTQSGNVEGCHNCQGDWHLHGWISDRFHEESSATREDKLIVRALLLHRMMP
jgi:hypothetical protein